jgi:tetratricopeptide (TPR) repeat protein
MDRGRTLLRRRAINEAVRDRIGKAISTQPTLLLLEDLHWIDGQSETAIEAILSLIADHPLLVVLTWRTENAPEWLAKLDVRKVWLRSLEKSAGKELLDDLIGAGDHLDEIKAQVLRHSGQVPLFIEEVARQLLDRGVLKQGGQIDAKSTWESLGIPPTVQGVIASRIDRLSRDDKSLQQLAAVVGPRVSPQLLAAVTGMPAPQLQSHLWSLGILDFLVESRWLASVEYEFSHDLVREVAYDSILRPQREDLHRRILAGLEKNSAGRAEEVAEALCHHAVKAQDWAKVDRFGGMAARKAFARSAFRDATEYYQVAMDAVDRLPHSVAREQRAIDLRVEARLTYVCLGNIEQWLALGRDGEARAEKIGDEGRRLASITIRAAALNFYGTPYEATTAGEQAVALADRLNNRTWLGLAEYGLGQAYFIAGRFAEAEPWLTRAIARFSDNPQDVPPGTTATSLLVLCHMMKAILSAYIGEHDEAVRNAQRARVRQSEQSSVRPDCGRLCARDGPFDRRRFRQGRRNPRRRRPAVARERGSAVPAARAVHARECPCAKRPRLTGRADSAGSEAGGPIGRIPDRHGSRVGLSGFSPCATRRSRPRHRDGAQRPGRCQAEGLPVNRGAGAACRSNDPFAGGHLGRSGDCPVGAGCRHGRAIGMRPLSGIARGALARLLAVSGRKSGAQDELNQAIELFAKSKMTAQLERARLELAKLLN